MIAWFIRHVGWITPAVLVTLGVAGAYLEGIQNFDPFRPLIQLTIFLGLSGIFVAFVRYGRTARGGRPTPFTIAFVWMGLALGTFMLGVVSTAMNLYWAWVPHIPDPLIVGLFVAAAGALLSVAAVCLLGTLERYRAEIARPADPGPLRFLFARLRFPGRQDQ